jgi:hypothetical protein
MLWVGRKFKFREYFIEVQRTFALKWDILGYYYIF